MRKVILATAMAGFYLTGCSLLPGGETYDTIADGLGRIIQPDDSGTALPSEELSELGNKSPYSVNGRFYYVMEDPAHYRARGKASWYGGKLQGHKTSSGEDFDMYAMTAAHRNLPLPTYLEVTNLDNGMKVVVKVNDRGPFVDDRLLDLSYAAASKLGMTEKGNAPVEVRALTGADVVGARRQVAEGGRKARAFAENQGEPLASASLPAKLKVERMEGAAGDVADDVVKSAGGLARDSLGMVAGAPVIAPSVITAPVATPIPTPVANPVTVPAAAAASIAKTTADSVSDKPLALQLGAFSKLEGATTYMNKAQALVPAIPAFITEGQSNGSRIYRVRVGPVSSKRLIAEATAALADGGITGLRVLPMQDGGDCIVGCR